MATTLAILGGGQLAQMLGDAATGLGIGSRALDPDPDACAARSCEMIRGELSDPAALEALLDGANAVTIDRESVPPEAIDAALRAGVPIRPGRAALDAASDRLHEKQLFVELGMRVPAFEAVDDIGQLRESLQRVGFPAMLKARRGGYDGRGQAVIRHEEDIEPAWRIVGVPSIIEERVELLSEVSAILCRDDTGHAVHYPLTKNVHEHGILIRSDAPADAPGETAAEAAEWANALADRLSYVGVLALELFITPRGLLANEFAPRVHNSGHWTIEGAAASQFENHVRAVCGLPIKPAEARAYSAMLNIIGGLPEASPPHPAALTRNADAAEPSWHLYGKDPRPGRKLGHVTVSGDSPATVEQIIETLAGEVRASNRFAQSAVLPSEQTRP
ncbi:MAG: 5-(carboxyamino)imidazole ribonucleotide synthase [Planctomycetota bacterium]